MPEMRALVIVLGDQLDWQSSAFDDFDPACDSVWMAEAAEESTHVWSGKQRIAVFLAAMRHFASHVRNAGMPVDYTRLDEAAGSQPLAVQLRDAIARLKPQRLVMCAPGDWRVYQSLRAVAAESELALDVREDRHFFSTVREFAAHAEGRKSLRLEYFYRELRQRHDVLMESGKPVGGQWNYDADNRGAFGAAGPGALPPPLRFEPDATTRDVIDLVNTRFADHPGSLDSFAWPVTREQALQALAVFIEQRLPNFGNFQDAMWPGEPWLYHSLLSAALNLKLLNPREVVEAAEAAFHAGHAPLAGVEGFVRQILGWREFVRGIYWTQMPAYLEHNALDAHEPLPGWYWSAETENQHIGMACRPARQMFGRGLEVHDGEPIGVTSEVTEQGGRGGVGRAQAPPPRRGPAFPSARAVRHRVRSSRRRRGPRRAEHSNRDHRAGGTRPLSAVPACDQRGREGCRGRRPDWGSCRHRWQRPAARPAPRAGPEWRTTSSCRRHPCLQRRSSSAADRIERTIEETACIAKPGHLFHRIGFAGRSERVDPPGWPLLGALPTRIHEMIVFEHSQRAVDAGEIHRRQAEFPQSLGEFVAMRRTGEQRNE